MVSSTNANAIAVTPTKPSLIYTESAEPTGGGANLEPLLAKLIRGTWKYLLVTTIASVAVAVYWANENNTSVFEVQSRLAFNRSSIGAPLYQSPDVHTLVAEFDSREAIETLRNEMSLKVPAEVIERRFKSSVRRGNGSIDVSLTWANEEDAIRLLDGIVAIGNTRARAIRDTGIDQFVSSMREVISTRYEPEVERLNEEYKRLSNEFGVEDIELAAADMAEEVSKLRDEIQREKISFQAGQKYRKLLTREPITLVSTTANSANSVSPVTSIAPLSATQQSPSAMLRRMEEIKAEIERERNRAVTEAKLKSKESELTRLGRLANAKLIPQSRYEALKAETEQLRLAVRGNSPMQEMEDELVQLTSKMEAYGNDPNAAAEAVREVERSVAAVDQQIMTSKVRIDQLQDLLNETEPQLENFEAAMPRVKTWERQMKVAAERLRTQTSSVENLENLKGTDAHVFTVLSQAAPALNNETNDYRKQFALAFLTSWLLLAAPGLALGLRSVLPSPGESLAKRIGVGQLGTASLADLSVKENLVGNHPESIRLLAARLKRLIGGDAVVQIVGLTGQASTQKLVERVGGCLAESGTSVAIVIVGCAEESKLSMDGDRYQRFEIMEHQAEDILARVHEIREDERLTLVVGLDCSRVADIELLGLKAEAVVLSAPGGQSIPDSAQAAALSLARYQAPILGVVT